MPRIVTYQILDEADGRFAVVATMEPDRAYRRDGLATLAEAEAWVEGLRVLMAACGSPLVRASAPAGEPVEAAPPVPFRAARGARRPRAPSVGQAGAESTGSSRR